MASKRERDEDKAEAIAILQEILPPGSVVYAIIRSVARSGMSRTMDLYAMEKGEAGPHLRYLTGYVSRVLGLSRDKEGAARIHGCGMDMVFATVHDLSYALHGREDRAIPEERKGRPVSPTRESYRGGYSLRHEVL